MYGIQFLIKSKINRYWKLIKTNDQFGWGPDYKLGKKVVHLLFRNTLLCKPKLSLQPSGKLGTVVKKW